MVTFTRCELQKSNRFFTGRRICPDVVPTVLSLVKKVRLFYGGKKKTNKESNRKESERIQQNKDYFGQKNKYLLRDKRPSYGSFNRSTMADGTIRESRFGSRRDMSDISSLSRRTSRERESMATISRSRRRLENGRR